jgi:hypothetical protein
MTRTQALVTACFFANRENGLPLDECPDNDGHNVDTIDGLVNLTPIVISNLGKGKDAVGSSVKESLALFRKSAVLPQFGTLYASMLSAVISGADLRETLVAGGRAMRVDVAAFGPNDVREHKCVSRFSLHDSSNLWLCLISA